MQQQHQHDTERGGGSGCGWSSTAAPPLSWARWRSANAGRGWTRQEWGRQWQLYKQQQQQQPAASTCSNTTTSARLADLRAGIAALTGSSSRAAEPAGACSPTPIKQQQQQVAPTAASSPAAVSSHAWQPSPEPAAVRPSVSPSPSPSAPTPSLHELLTLRAAVHQLLGTQAVAAAPPQLLGTQAVAAAPPQERDASSAVRAGCLGALSAAAARRGGAKLPWNSFQKACKGRGMSKRELSAAFAAAKRQEAPLDLDSFLDSWVEQQRKHERQQQQQREAASRWGTLKHWVSRTGSRAASRAVSPGSSPAAAPPPAAEQRQPVAGKWGSLKQWVQSRSGSRAGSRLASPALSPEEQQHAREQQQAADAGDSSLPFAAQLSLAAAACDVDGSSRSTASQPEAPHTPQAGARALDALPAAAGSDSPSSQAASSSLPIGSRHGTLVLPCGGSCPVVWIGRRVARETVPDDLPGLLAGFCAWQRVHTDSQQQLKQLKCRVPARPGVYEWGVRLQPHGHVLGFYVGKAGTLQQRPRRTSAAARDGVATGETLRTRLNRYLITSRARVGPKQELHKDLIFAQYQAAGGQLFYRWWVATGPEEPVEMERALLARLDYAANYQHNLDRRRLLAHHQA